MEESDSKAKVIVFIIVFLLLLGGSYYFFTNYESKKDDNSNTDIIEKSKAENINKEIKIDEEKELIYFEPLEVVSVELGIINEYPIININTEKAKVIEEEIKTKVKALEKTIVYCELAEEKALCEDNIKEVKEIHYEIYSYKNYTTLVVLEGTYSCFEEGSEAIVSSYTFDTKTGELIEFDKLLDKYDLTMNDVKTSIRPLLNERLKEISKNDESMNSFIKIDSTINNLKVNNTIIAYINNKGELMINFVVITEHVNYNETMIIS